MQASSPSTAPAEQHLASVLHYNSFDEIVQALEQCSVDQNKDWWQLSKYDAETTLPSSSPQQEAERLQVLRDYQILECPSVPTTLQQLTERARNEFQVPFVLISLVDMERQWFLAQSSKSNNLPQATKRCDAFCNHTIQLRETSSILQVSDATQDQRFLQNPYVTGEPNFRFYAGVPLLTSISSSNADLQQHRLGAFCLLDDRPRRLSTEQQDKLRQYAKVAMYILDERKKKLTVPAGSSSTTNNNKRPPNQVAPSSLSHPTATTGERSSSPSSSPPLKKSRSIEDLPKLKTQATAQSPQQHTPQVSTAAFIPKLRVDAVLPDPKKAGVDPDTFLRQLVEAMYGVTVQVRPALDLPFGAITEEQISAYKPEIVSMARENNIQGLRELVQEHGPHTLNCFNRFGEGLLNLACRRGFQDMVQYLVTTTSDHNNTVIAVRTRDDYGRTPLHDACWHPEPQLRTCTLLMERDPCLFLIADKRGYTPFQYARSSDWHIWRAFLFRNRHHLVQIVTAEPSFLKKE